jgi:hypothetical protein
MNGASAVEIRAATSRTNQPPAPSPQHRQPPANTAKTRLTMQWWNIPVNLCAMSTGAAVSFHQAIGRQHGMFHVKHDSSRRRPRVGQAADFRSIRLVSKFSYTVYDRQLFLADLLDKQLPPLELIRRLTVSRSLVRPNATIACHASEHVTTRI